MKSVPSFAILSLSILAIIPAHGATTLFTDRSTFESSLVALETQDYSGIAQGTYTNAQIDTLLGASAPIHRTTGGTFGNQIFQETFNASNTTFRITFSNTNVGTVDGVFGVGFDYGQINQSMDAFVTFGDNSTQNYDLDSDPSPFSTPDFFGISSDQLIKSVHISFPTDVSGFGSTSVVFDNLTYGSDTAIPEPSTALFSLISMAALGFRRRRS